MVYNYLDGFVVGVFARADGIKTYGWVEMRKRPHPGPLPQAGEGKIGGISGDLLPKRDISGFGSKSPEIPQRRYVRRGHVLSALRGLGISAYRAPRVTPFGLHPWLTSIAPPGLSLCG